ncbi:ring-cleaving dioxygenase [Fodinibius salsisoli]|uniref:Ring-cleaving dioxygenase n=1 Tax=Fodinibius salsisoli TaxID=2820877 RepID=A0ABT3PSV3_9BACT|nr:ring-cleaving dioxygenase [Fodinibius salsisoli]MCW9708954.1 ring-cleaving dioxygenase [Fodinibius salsisoli]
MNDTSKGIHHITVLAGNAQRNADFYVKSLGMRLVKKSVNQDDPGTYHLFYGNAEASPGSGLTFFPWPMARQGKPGLGEAVKVAFAVPTGSVNFWAERFGEEGIDFDGPYDRFGQQAISFKDPDHLQLELVFDKQAEQLPGWEKGSVPAQHGIRGFRGTTLRLKETEPTANVLENVFGFQETDSTENTRLYTTDAPIGGSVIIEEGEEKPSANGRGIIHHVAFRAKDDDELSSMRKQVLEMGLSPTDVIDRHWFHSVYFKSPGGVLFEIATDGPGYAVDEDADKLGQKLILPPWLEPRRKMIEKRLPEINV